jgi:hypothetical protein
MVWYMKVDPSLNAGRSILARTVKSFTLIVKSKPRLQVRTL